MWLQVFFGAVKKTVPHDAPDPRGGVVDIFLCVNSGHAGVSLPDGKGLGFWYEWIFQYSSVCQRNSW